MSVVSPGRASADESCVVTLSSVCGEPAPGPQPEPSPSTTSTTAAPAPPPSPAQAASRLLALANEARAAAGVAPLSSRGDVAEIAEGWSGAMSRAGALSHNDEYFSAETKRRLDAGLRGENVAFAGSIDQAHRALMDSPPHRANLLDARFSVVGMGAVFVDGTWWVTQDFLQPRSPAAAPAPSPAPAPTRDERARALPAAESAEPARRAGPAEPHTNEAADESAHEVAVLSASPAVPEQLDAAAAASPADVSNSDVPAGQDGSALPFALVAMALAAAAAVGILVRH